MKVINTKINYKEAIKQAYNTLKNGGLVVYPTDTCFGLGADATNKEAVNNVFDFKGDRQKPIAIAVCSRQMAKKYVEINEIADNLYQNFLPGAITVVSKSRKKVASRLESKLGTLGVRIPNYSLTRDIITSFGKPITTTSANASGQKPPYSLDDFLKYNSKKRIDMINLFLDPGPLPLRTPSTVVDTTLNEPIILRQGEIKLNNVFSVYETTNPQETYKVASKILNKVKTDSQPIIFALQGELGAGKTQFAKGLAKQLGIKSMISSPTFNIIREYPINSTAQMFYHIDTWRLEKGEELLELGLKKMICPNNIIVIEWPQKVKEILKKIAKDVLLVLVDIETISETKRKIRYQILP
jgi:tRNA threonylcarbamoyl adenosine modification protein (Sua5/YciO/YrdC/YwlC family)/tRNA threonylcarbamoyl adenosine modification protein YjeE